VCKKKKKKKKKRKTLREVKIKKFFLKSVK